MQFLWLILFIPFSVAAQHKQSILVLGGISKELGCGGQYDYGFGGRVSWQHELIPNFDLGVRFGYGKFNINREKILSQSAYLLNKPSVSVIEDNLFGKSTTWFSLGLNGSVKLNPNQKCRMEIPLEIGLCNVVHSGYSLYGEDYAGWGGGAISFGELATNTITFYKSMGFLFKVPVSKRVDLLLSGQVSQFSFNVQSSNWYSSLTSKQFLVLYAGTGIGIKL